jgi:C4-dicarboxylate transporter, DctM subunit
MDASMSPLAIGALGMTALFVLIVAKVPIGIAMIVVGVGGFAFQMGWWPALTLLVGDPSAYLASIDLATIPLFLLMGTFASAAGFSKDLYAVAAAFLGHRRGGLAHASIGGCAAFGCVCGSSIATAATFAKIALPEMLRRGYEPGFAAGTVAAGGALKSLIPPSLIMVLYCVVANTFILDLFVAAIVPAILVVIFNFSAIALYARFNPSATPVSPRASWNERRVALRGAIPAAILMICVFGGLYSGIFTVNEAASVAAVLAVIFALVRGRLDWSTISEGLLEAARVTAMIYIVVFGAAVFGYFMTVARVPEALVALVQGFNLPPTLTIVALLIAYIILGAVFDEISAMLITLPFVLPIIVALGYDPVWWGVINVVIIELGLIVPPIGLIVFVLHGMAPEISLKAIYRGVVPFIAADVALLTLLTLIPDTAMWLPKVIAR